ncbi:M16 family metallopeptidase [Kitasatospora sp. NPDC101155]|uniref:M16 family metallopeptidase n=1 Tax=Kitasatospora sp. NPDC101155 TaxID=3364097 RepID=UPI003809BED9
MRRTTTGPRDLPPLGVQQAFRLPETADVVLPEGLRVVCLRSPSAPMIELVLRIPFLCATENDGATAEVLATTLLRGALGRGEEDVDTELARAGCSLGAVRRSDRIEISGSGPSAALETLVGVLADVLTGASHAGTEVDRARRRLAERLPLLRARPSTLAAEALRVHCRGDSPALRLIPAEAAVASVTADGVRALHRAAVVPAGAQLVLVGDLDPERTVALLAARLREWRSRRPVGTVVPRAPEHWQRPVRLVDRPGSVQSLIRLVSPAPARTDPRFAALSLANVVFGGSFSSRLLSNVRERGGYAYWAGSRFDDILEAMVIAVNADTATDTTVSAVAEIRAELRSMATKPVTDDELRVAGNYLLGASALAMSSQVGLATAVSTTIGFGLPPQWLESFSDEVRSVTGRQVRELAEEMFASATFTGVVLGDARLLAGPLGEHLDMVLA